MTLAELRALRPSWREPDSSIPLDESVKQFCWFGVNGTDPASLTDDQLMTILAGALLVDSSESPAEIVSYSDAVSREYGARVGSSKAALAWLMRNERVARTYLVARLFCPKGKKMAELYCLPKDADYVGKSAFRLLVVPTSRGRVLALIGDPKKSRRPGIAWWYLSDDDVWDLRCKCCPRPDDGVRAGDFLGEDAGRGYTAVLA